MQAVILAAGQGTRIRDFHALPKGFIQIDHKPLIMYSLEALRAQGIDDILVVTGYGHEHYDVLAAKTKLFKTIYNAQFATYSNFYSLYLARDWVQDSCLVIESDIIYEPRAITNLLHTPSADVILVSGPTQSGDEVYVEVDEHRQLVNLSKQRSQLNAPILGEFVGLTRLSKQAFETLVALADRDIKLLRDGYYDEDAWIALTKQRPLHCQFVSDLVWSEIDNVDHLQRAERLFSKKTQMEV